MNNNYGQNPKKKICIIKDIENKQQKEDYKDNEDTEINEDDEVDEQSLSREHNEDNDNSLFKYKYNEDNEENEDYESRELDSSKPRYSCDNNGNASVFLLGGSIQRLKEPRYSNGRLVRFVDEHLPWYVNDMLNKYKKLNKKFGNRNQNYVVQKLDAYIDFREILINDIQKLKIDKFYFNNLTEINLSLFLDFSLETQAIKFIQSILNLQSLKKCRIYIMPEFNVKEDEDQYVEKIQKQLEFNPNIKEQDFQVFRFRGQQFGFKIFSDEGKINKLYFYSFAEIKLEIQQLESVQILEMDCDSDYQPFFSRLYSYISLNEFFKKLINLKFLKFKLSDQYKEDQYQIELFKIISEFKQIKQLQINCHNISSHVKQIKLEQNLEYLTLSFAYKAEPPIQSPNLTYLNITYSMGLESFGKANIKRQLGTLKNLRILNMSIHLQQASSTHYIDEYDEAEAEEIGSKIRQQLIKYFKKLVIFTMEYSSVNQLYS